MIVYTNSFFGLSYLVRVHGSAAYKALVPSIVSTGFFLFLQYATSLEEHEMLPDTAELPPDAAELFPTNRLLLHPFAVGAFISFFSFLLTFRLNFAYGRYWEAATAVHQMLSKWLDCLLMLAALHYQARQFDDIKPPSFGANPTLKSKDVINRERNCETTYEQYVEALSTSLMAASHDDGSVTKQHWWQPFLPQRPRSIPRKSFPKTREGEAKNINSKPSNSSAPTTRIPIPLRFQRRFDLNASEAGRRSLRMSFSRQSRAYLDLGTVKDFKIPRPTLFLQEAAHLVSLLAGVAMATLRNDDPVAEVPLTEYIPGMPWPPVDPDNLSAEIKCEYGQERAFVEWVYFCLGLTRTKRHRTLYNAARPFPILGGVSDSEAQMLYEANGPLAKVTLCTMWLQEFITREHLTGGTGSVEPPIISRIYQFVSDGV